MFTGMLSKLSRKAITSVLPEAAAARLLHQSVMYRHQALEREHAEIRRTAASRAQVAKSISGRVARRAVANAVKNVASVAAEIVPMFGSAAVIALTISDVYDDCQTLKDLNELNTAFGDERHDEAHVCGMKVPFSN
jgi:hypothetical protein